MKLRIFAPLTALALVACADAPPRPPERAAERRFRLDLRPVSVLTLDHGTSANERYAVLELRQLTTSEEAVDALDTTPAAPSATGAAVDVRTLTTTQARQVAEPLTEEWAEGQRRRPHLPVLTLPHDAAIRLESPDGQLALDVRVDLMRWVDEVVELELDDPRDGAPPSRLALPDHGSALVRCDARAGRRWLLVTVGRRAVEPEQRQ